MATLLNTRVVKATDPLKSPVSKAASWAAAQGPNTRGPQRVLSFAF